MVVISVLIPIYNHERYIEETIESVLNQTFTDLELIIIDNFSTDNSREIIINHQKKDSRIKTVFHKENEGISASLNELINLAKGKYIAFLNSDDLWHETKLEKQLSLLEKDENLIIWTEGEIINKYSNPIGRKFSKTFINRKKKLSGDIFKVLLHGNYILFASLMFKRDNLKGLRFIEDLKIGNDYPFLLALAKKFKFHFIKEPLTYYRWHGKNTTLINNENRLIHYKDRIIVWRYILETYNKEIPKLLKWRTNSDIAHSYLVLNKKKQAKFFIFKALYVKPLVLLNFWYLIIYFKFQSNLIKKVKNKLERIFTYLEIIYREKVYSLTIE